MDFWKQKDPRRLYSAGSGWPSISANDVDVTPESRAYPVHSAAIEVAHFGPRDLLEANIRWRLREVGGKRVVGGNLTPKTLPTGQLTSVGEIVLPLAPFDSAIALNLEIDLPGTRFANDWNVWVYPAATANATPTNVTLTQDLDPTALAVLEGGGRVVLLADARRVAGRTVGRFDPIFWNKLWFPSQPQHTLGLLLPESP